MSVNPQLATLMGLIDELQDQMPEGKYLEAMNALRDLHGGVVRQRNPQMDQNPMVAPPRGMVRLTQEESELYTALEERRRQQTIPATQLAYETRSSIRRACDDRGVTYMDWMAMTYEDKFEIIKTALEFEYEDRWERRQSNPDPRECTWVARHAVGEWGSTHSNRGRWSCVCGSKNILSKKWQTHEQSEKHQHWVRTGRQVTKHLQKRMKESYDMMRRHQDTLLGFHSHALVPKSCMPQTKNEWTHPELFPDPLAVYEEGDCFSGELHCELDDEMPDLEICHHPDTTNNLEWAFRAYGAHPITRRLRPLPPRHRSTFEDVPITWDMYDADYQRFRRSFFDTDGDYGQW